MQICAGAGFELKAVEEAKPSQEMLDIPSMRDELHRPMMLLVKAQAEKQMERRRETLWI